MTGSSGRWVVVVVVVVVDDVLVVEVSSGAAVVVGAVVVVGAGSDTTLVASAVLRSTPATPTVSVSARSSSPSMFAITTTWSANKQANAAVC